MTPTLFQSRPGLPLFVLGRAGECRQRWVWSVVHVLRFRRPLSWCVLELLHDGTPLQLRELPRRRPSVALPLGIKCLRALRNSSLYPSFTNTAAEMRSISRPRDVGPARPEGSSVRDKARKSPARLKGHILWVGIQPTHENCRGRRKPRAVALKGKSFKSVARF